MGLLFAINYGSLAQSILHQCQTGVQPMAPHLANFDSNVINYQSKVSSAITYLPVIFHVVRSTNKVGGELIGGNYLEKMLDTVNMLYAATNIQFYQCKPVDYINNDFWYNKNYTYDDTLIVESCTNQTSNEYTLANTFMVNNCINIFWVNQTNYGQGGSWSALPGGSNSNGVRNSGFCEDWIYRNYNYNLYPNGGIMAHELGHYLSLYHTFESYFGREHILRLQNDPCFNASTTGDKVSDTEAEPWSISNNVLTLYYSQLNPCSYTSGLPYDGCGATNYNSSSNGAAIKNIMSYSSCSTLNFTAGQIARMNALIAASVFNCNSISSCSSNFNLTSSLNISDFKYQATNSITCAATLPSGKWNRLQAGNYIDLKTNFTALSGSDFIASNGNCWSTNLKQGTFEETDLQVPDTENELSVFPNPFSSEINISFTLAETKTVNMYLFDAMGKLITQVASNGLFSAGQNSIIYNSSDLPAGLYFIKLITPNKTMQQKIIKM